MGKLIHAKGRVIVTVDMQYKNKHTFSNGKTIVLVRQVNNFDRKYTEPVNAIIVSSDNIPEFSEVLIHPNSTHDTNRIFNYTQLSGKKIASEINTYSIREEDCYLWRKGTPEWTPCAAYATGLRVYEPHAGMIVGIPPKRVKDVLYVTSGKYKGEVIKTMRACDYELIFNDLDGREKRIIRFRPEGDYSNPNPAHHREAEAIAILHGLTSKVKAGKLFVGVSVSDCGPVKSTYAR